MNADVQQGIAALEQSGLVRSDLDRRVDSLLALSPEDWHRDCADYLLCPGNDRSVWMQRDLELRERVKEAMDRRRKGEKLDPVAELLCENLEMHVMREK